MAVHLSVLPTPILESLKQQPTKGEQLANTRFLRLPHPRTGIPSLYLPNVRDQQTLEILEVQAVSPPNSRSWFLEEEVIGDGKLLIMTPMDPALLLIPIFYPAFLNRKEKGHSVFLPFDDFVEEALSAATAHYNKLSNAQDASTLVDESDLKAFLDLPTINQALKRICDVKEPTPEITAYCFSPTKLNDYLRAKVSRIAHPQVFENSRTLLRGLAKDGLLEDGKEQLLVAGRIRSACDLVSHYLHPALKASLIESYAQELEELEVYLDHLRQQAAAQAAMEEAAGGKKRKGGKTSEAEKKQKGAKGAEAEKKPKGATKTPKASKGVESLKKVNVEGVKKISSFFKKA